MAAFNRTYGLLAASLLALELGIARFVHDGLVRSYAGDMLATILVYCLLKTWWRTPAGVAVGVALLISYALEVGQALHLLAWLAWQHVRVARLLLGSQFAWGDLLAYTLGAALVVLVERGRATSSR
jgi:hypothetical protein